MLPCSINKRTDCFLTHSARALLGNGIRLLRIIYIAILLQGLSTTAFAGWVNFWPFWVSECTECPRFLERDNLFGPLFEQRYTDYEHVAAIRPVGVHIDDYRCRESFDYFLYPIFTRTNTMSGSSWNMLGFISGCDSPERHRVTIFPLFFSYKTHNPCTSYAALFPIGGKIRNHFCMDSISWFLFPLYLGLEQKCTVRHALPWPFIRWQTGPDSGGGALWPLAGHFWRGCDYEHSYLLWPLIYRRCDRLCDPIPCYRIGFLPFFAYEYSARKEMMTIIWPFFSHVRMHDRNYVEDQFLWPFFVQGRGDCEYVNRWAPFYTHSIRRGHDKRWFLWPLLKIQQYEDRGVCIKQEQLLYFVFWKQRQTCLTNPCAPEAKKMHLWPLYSYWDNGAGQKQFQFLSPFEVFFPTNRAIRNTYSPLFAIFRHEQIEPGHTRQSILFDLIASESTPCSQHFSIGPIFEMERSPCRSGFQILNGLLGFKKENGKKSLKLLWIGY